jgi:hypothetical protein
LEVEPSTASERTHTLEHTFSSGLTQLMEVTAGVRKPSTCGEEHGVERDLQQLGMHGILQGVSKSVQVRAWVVQ